MKYTYAYHQGAWGSDCHVTVFDEKNNIVGVPRDPFWNYGIPVSKLARLRRIKKIAREIIRDVKEDKNGM